MGLAFVRAGRWRRVRNTLRSAARVIGRPRRLPGARRTRIGGAAWRAFERQVRRKRFTSSPGNGRPALVALAVDADAVVVEVEIAKVQIERS